MQTLSLSKPFPNLLRNPTPPYATPEARSCRPIPQTRTNPPFRENLSSFPIELQLPRLRLLPILSVFLPLFLLLLAPAHTHASPPTLPGDPRAQPPLPRFLLPAPGTAAPQNRDLQPPYRLLPNDVLHIRVFQETDLETSARVSKSGTVPFPLVGNITLAGRTVPEATALLESALREYLVHPQVALRILEYSKRKFTVLGQVNRPGTYDFPDESSLSLLEGLGMAGGYTRLANPTRITIRRSSTEGESVHRVDARKMAKEADSQRFTLQPGDTILVDESLF
jgi:polysaccharide export outer membrane protein